ncbi:polysaccharide biosynthesis/export family protein [Chelativorans salis]|uniref:Polysaccharide biosynthesis/export family protein n=1 Tax=Chelativorans salis TaxID=2978478 RepID=A0ABT2LTL8_9HYPH|nr:polysaccharide biosynthesis/export family protein [Chelativorans sp. EGI FJ00035]MCT7377844.1 polysaccharide biosynthesis/export family protein [Chelativorans sp. EGI FJ00035]
MLHRMGPYAGEAASKSSIPLFRSRLVSVLAAIMTLLLPVVSGAEEYLLGPMDKLHIRVAEWQSADASARDWSSVSGDYTVGPSGSISIPFIGELPATGKTTAELAATIGDELQQTLGLLTRPDASVEVAEFRPFFISGDVQAPGKYAYDPGLTVLKAISVAGGLRRAQNEGMRVERDYINAHGNHEVLAAEHNRLIARRARLMAEAEGATAIEPPEELAGSAEGKRLIAKETAFMKAREEQMERSLSALDDLKKLLTGEIESLEKKIATQNRQIQLSREELEGIGGLAERGLVVNQRILGAERSIADLEGKVLDMETAKLRARQDISRAERDAATLRDEREAEIARQLQETEAEIEALDLKIAMYRGLMTEAASLAPEAALSTATASAEVSYRIVRSVDEETQEIAADENTAVRPGDVIKVDVVPPSVQ